MLSETQTWLGIDWAAVGAIATVVLAAVTAGLAGATYWLGRETRDMAAETRTLASSTTRELELLDQQTAAIKKQAEAGREQLDELREARFAEFLPVLHWQLHPNGGGGYQASADAVRLNLSLLLTNVGRGPARIPRLAARSPQIGDLGVVEVAIPSTLPTGERIELRLFQRRPPRDFPGEVEVDLDVVYADVAMLRQYQTLPSVVVDWSEGGTGVLRLNADDISPDARRYDPEIGLRRLDLDDALRREVP